MTTQTRVRGPNIIVEFSPEQMAVLENFRVKRGWTKSRLFEEALRVFFAERDIPWPANPKRIA